MKIRRVICLSKVKLKRFSAISLIVLSFFLLSYFSAELILVWLSLPPFSPETEGKYAAFHLRVMSFVLWILPLCISLFLVGCLIFPQISARFSVEIRIFSLLVAVAGFVGSVILICLAAINRVSFLLAFIGASPLWITAILALFTFKRLNVKETH